MSVPVVSIAPDLSVVRLHAPAGGAVWRAPALNADDGAPTSGAWAGRAQAAAAWLAQQRGVKRRLGAVVIDPAESVCLWVRSSSLAPPVLSAAVGRLTEDWGDAATMWAVEPVFDAPRDLEQGGDHALSAVCHHDAIARLFLDALDKRGIVPGSVLSGWHAMAMHAGVEQRTTCVIAHEPEAGRVVWVWTDAGGMLAGGTAAVGDLSGEHAESVANATIQRAALDWMTWSSQLGTTPERALVLGPGADALAHAWAKSFPDRPVQVQKTDDAEGATLEYVSRRAEESGAAGLASSTRVCLGRISHRPTRRVRKRYQYAALAALLAGVAIGSVAVRLNRKASEFRDRAEVARVDSRTLVEETWPGGMEGRPTSIAREAQRLYEDEVNADDLKLPEAPKPLFEEVARVAELLTSTVEDTVASAPEEMRDDWAIRIRRLVFDNTTLRLSLQVPKREVATEVGVRLNADDANAAWELLQFGSANATLPTYQGNWQKQ